MLSVSKTSSVASNSENGSTFPVIPGRVSLDNSGGVGADLADSTLEMANPEHDRRSRKRNPSFRESAETARFLPSHEVRPGIGRRFYDLVAQSSFPGTELCGLHFSKMKVRTALHRSL